MYSIHSEDEEYFRLVAWLGLLICVYLEEQKKMTLFYHEVYAYRKTSITYGIY